MNRLKKIFVKNQIGLDITPTHLCAVAIIKNKNQYVSIYSEKFEYFSDHDVLYQCLLKIREQIDPFFKNTVIGLDDALIIKNEMIIDASLTSEEIFNLLSRKSESLFKVPFNELLVDFYPINNASKKTLHIFAARKKQIQFFVDSASKLGLKIKSIGVSSLEEQKKIDMTLNVDIGLNRALKLALHNL